MSFPHRKNNLHHNMCEWGRITLTVSPYQCLHCWYLLDGMIAKPKGLHMFIYLYKVHHNEGILVLKSTLLTKKHGYHKNTIGAINPKAPTCIQGHRKRIHWFSYLLYTNCQRWFNGFSLQVSSKYKLVRTLVSFR